jgi:HPt (histidine-containing phosphotransfer) domain-containing protein
MLDDQPAPAINAKALDLLVQMIGLDEPGAVLDLLDTYIEDSTGQIEELQQVYAAGDLKNTHRLAHSMKSSSATFGALELSKCCESLERSARDNCADGRCESELRRVVDEHARVIASLTNLRSRFIE